ncbi:MAG: hypothetical protein WEE64_16130 [Dehalococcoidia bacterium]
MERGPGEGWPEAEDGEEEELEGEWELDPNDPTHPDYDLSEAAGYGDWEPAPKPLFLRRGVVLIITVLTIVGLMIPVVWRLLG